MIRQLEFINISQQFQKFKKRIEQKFEQPTQILVKRKYHVKTEAELLINRNTKLVMITDLITEELY